MGAEISPLMKASISRTVSSGRAIGNPWSKPWLGLIITAVTVAPARLRSYFAVAV
jgi:hypothetical protein